MLQLIKLYYDFVSPTKSFCYDDNSSARLLMFGKVSDSIGRDEREALTETKT